MWLPEDENKFTSRFKYVEFAKWAFSKTQDRWSVFRDTEFVAEGEPRKPILYSREEIQKKISAGGEGLYTSAFSFDKRDLHRAQSISSLYFDLDSNEKIGQSVDHSLIDARKLYDHLAETIPEWAIRLYFTGKKGFHIEVEAVTLGVGPSADLADTFRYIAQTLSDNLGLETVDFQVYDPRRMWRIPNTKHQGTGLFKVPLTREELQMDLEDIKSLAKSPRDMPVPDQEFTLKANEWFRSFVYEKEEKSVTPAERVSRFMKRGTGAGRHVDELDFDPTGLAECDAIDRLWKKAESTGDLEHEERLFLCSILTYSDMAIEYLHAILSNCDDYTPDKSQAHIDDWIRRRDNGTGGHPYSCERARFAGIQCGGCSKLEPREKYEVIAGKMIPTGEMAKPSPVRVMYRKRQTNKDRLG